MTCSRLVVVITAGMLMALPISSASAQLGGLWTVSVDSCCTYPEGQECESDTLSIAVAQNGSQLSGWSMESGEIPPQCGNVTCTPTTPNCDQPMQLAGTLSGNAVSVTFSRQQTLHASCSVMEAFCQLDLSVASVAHAQGTVAGQTITGSFDSQNTFSCQVTGGPECEGVFECGDVPCTGTFQVAVGPSCMGDCAGDSRVTVDELLLMVNVALGGLHVASCGAGDGNGDGQITVDEILIAVNHALSSCA